MSEIRIVCTLSTALKIPHCSKIISVVTFLGTVYQEILNYYRDICLELLKKNMTIIKHGQL